MFSQMLQIFLCSSLVEIIYFLMIFAPEDVNISRYVELMLVKYAKCLPPFFFFFLYTVKELWVLYHFILTLYSE